MFPSSRGEATPYPDARVFYWGSSHTPCDARALRLGKPFKELFANFSHPGMDGMLQFVGSLKPVCGEHPEPASEKNHFIGTGWGQDKVLGMATDNSEAINELSEIQIVVFELGPILKTEEAFPAQVIDGLERIGRPDGGMVVPMHELKILHGILHIKKATRSVFDVRGSRPDQFFDLTFTEVEGGL